MIDDEDDWLGNGREQSNNCIDKGFLKLFISTLILVFFRQIMEADAIQSIVIDSNEEDNLSKEGNGKPDIENRIGSSDIRDFPQRFSVWKEVEVYWGQNAQH